MVASLGSPNKIKVKSQTFLITLHAATNRLILGAFRSSPTEALSHDTETIRFLHFAVRAHHHFIYKHLTASADHPTRKSIELSLRRITKTHEDPIQLLIGREEFLMLDGDRLETH